MSLSLKCDPLTEESEIALRVVYIMHMSVSWPVEATTSFLTSVKYCCLTFITFVQMYNVEQFFSYEFNYVVAKQLEIQIEKVKRYWLKSCQ